MNAQRILISSLLMIAISGCIFDNSDEGDKSEADSYFPFKTGAKYTFSITETDLSGNVISTSEETSTIMGKMMQRGKEYWGISDGNNGGMTFRIDGETVYSFIGFGDENSDSSGVEIMYCRFDVAPGTSWETPLSTFFDPQHNTDVSMTWKGTYVGEESVTVPAGSFDNCKKFDLRILAVIHSEVPVEAVHTKSISWFAPNVGMIRNVETIYSEGKESGMKDSRLTSYSIPSK